MIQAICGRPLILENKIRSQASQHGICSGQSVTLRAFPPSTSVFPCHCHSTNAPSATNTTANDTRQSKASTIIHSPLHPAINVIIPMINVLSNDGHGVRNRHERHSHL